MIAIASVTYKQPTAMTERIPLALTCPPNSFTAAKKYSENNLTSCFLVQDTSEAVGITIMKLLLAWFIHLDDGTPVGLVRT